MSIPKGWRICRIDELSHYITSGSRGWAQYYSDIGDLFVRITNLTREKLSLDLGNSKYVSIPEDNNEGKRTRLMRNDILISITADLGITGFINNEANKPAYINQHIALLRISEEEINNKFVAYQMASRSGREQFLSLNDAGAKSGLNLDSIRRFQITVPPIREQCRIAEILGVWDESIDLLEKLITAKRKLKQGIMQQLLTGKKSFEEFKDSKWEEVRLADLADVIDPHPSHRAPKEYLNGIPFVGIGDISENGEIDFSKVRKVHPSIADEHAKSYIVENGDIAFGRVASIGKVIKLQVTSFEYTISPTMSLIKPKNKINSSFLQYSLQSSAMSFQISTLTSGSTRKSLGIMNLRELMISTPSLKEQEKIAAVLSAADAEISTLEKQLAAYKEQKRGLMQQLLTGRTRILGLEDEEDKEQK